MGTVVHHPTVIDGAQRELAAQTTSLAEIIGEAASAFVRRRFGGLPPEAHNGIVAMACLNAAARASGLASVATGGDALGDWRQLATLGEAVIGDALQRAASAKSD